MYGRLLEDRIVFVGSKIDDLVANSIVNKLLVLHATDATGDIFLYINSPGGGVEQTMAIYDAMQYVSCDVGTICLGLAAGMAQLLLCAGAPGKRYALPHSRICLCAPSLPQQNDEVDVVERPDQAAQFLCIRRVWAECMARHTGHKVEQIEADSDRGRWFTSEEAKSHGIIDHIIQPSHQVPR